MWLSVLEAVFTAAGDEVALAGLKVSRGEELTEDEKARVRELVAEEERQAALEAGEEGVEDEVPESVEEDAHVQDGPRRTLGEEVYGMLPEVVQGLIGSLPSLFGRTSEPSDASADSSNSPPRNTHTQNPSMRMP
eukprot:Tamp_32067.p1 GENE.Tamp_32067~~Tamp_32067.p1  ORF type:complete len:135 (+),score=18.50 Tamp_32067:3-407(+)